MKTISKMIAGVAAAAFVAPLVVAKPAAKAPACVNDKTIQAMQIRIAQTELMVAGLSCKQYDQWAATANTKRYNEFVTRYQPVLMDDGHRVLKRFFPTEQRLNDYLTRLANEAQLRGNVNMAIFCTQASKIYDDLLNAGPVELAKYSASLPMAGQHGHDPCNPPAIQPTQAAVQPQMMPSPAAAEVPAQPAVRQPVAVQSPAPGQQTIASVIASNAGPGGMQPVPDVSMRPAVKRPPTPVLKPADL